MHAPGLRALHHPAVLAARAPRVLRRSLHVSTLRLNSANEGGKPPDDSTGSQDEDVQPQTGNEAAAGRSRLRASGSLKNRYARKQAAAPLPPVHLPQAFLDSSVTLFNAFEPPQLPLALELDTRKSKTSNIFVPARPSDTTSRVKGTNERFGEYFENALKVLLDKTRDQVDDFLKPGADLDKDADPGMLAHRLWRITRLFDLVLDSAWHLTDALYPAREPQYLYQSRPFWWWHYYKNFDHNSHQFRDQYLCIDTAIWTVVDHDWRLHHSLSQAIADLPATTFNSIAANIRRELAVPPPPKSEDKTLKRQITVLSMSGYSGQAISESVAKHVAYFAGADLVQLDAQDLSLLVGEYLGQDWAYSRGSLSNLGFRAAELNGKLHSEPEIASRATEDEDNDVDAGVINIRTSGASLEDELSKIHKGGYNVFDKWENLKIDKILDHLLQSAEHKAGSSRTEPLIIHIHDFVELNMTLEGSMLISRLRNLVDAAWQRGIKIAILGTSSSEQPSEEYQNMLRNMAAGDFVVSRHMDPSWMPRQPTSAGGLKKVVERFSLQDTDIFVENIRNINRMLKVMGVKESLDFSHVQRYSPDTDARAQLFKKGLLPLPEVYNVALSARRFKETNHELSLTGGVFERLLMGPARQRPGQRYLDEADTQLKSESEESKKAEEAQATDRASLKLNEYEKRISTGHINRQNLRTTFDDVHVPKETISALKLLTSLALVRPDAFSYGVLAQDKIPGCLLYGPPGTGKTLLAKAVAKESGANMLEISGATINDKWVGESEKLIHAVFTFAKKISPCVVFIDEADSLLANRSMLGARASHRSHINQFLKEWDGLEETEAFIMVATNRPFDLDDAVLRRLPRRLLVDLPLKPDRGAILKILLKGEDMDPSVSLDDLAARTPYYSGSDLKNVCVAAAMAAVEEENEAAAAHTGSEPYQYPKKRTLRQDHFEKALKQIPASISEDMQSLKQIRKFDEEYGAKKKAKKKTMGFGIGLEKKSTDAEEARIRRGP